MISELLRERSVGVGIKILLIEDNPGDAGLIEAALEESGGPAMELHVEQRLSSALARLSREKFTVILLDLNLPDSTGFDTVTAVQEVVPRVPVVIMTGSADEAFARRTIKAGVQDYLIKDNIRPTTLVRSILFAIERKQTENDLHALERVASAAGSSLDLNSMLKSMLDTIMEEMDGDRAALVLEADGKQVVKQQVGEAQGTESAEYRDLEVAMVLAVLRNQEPAFHLVRMPDGRVERTMLKVPLSVGGRAKGVVEVDWLSDHPENPRETSLLRVAADRIGAGVANAQAYEAVKASERHAEEERMRLRIIIDTLPVGILITDAKGKELESNSFRARVWGGRPRPSQGISDLCKLRAWMADTGEKIDECPVVKALKYGQTTLGAVIDIERLDGRRGTILNSAAPITDERGETLGAVGVQQDITDQVRLERELAEAKARAEFYIDLMTHDINNSLSSASSYLQFLQDAGRGDEREQRWLTGAENSLQEAMKLIETIRKVQRSHTLDMERSAIDLNAVLDEVITSTKARGDGHVEITYSTVDGAVVVGTELLRDLFTNLLGNAVKHSTGDVKVEVTVRPQALQGQEYFKVEVADNGPGISDELKGRLFRRGERGVSKAPGRGLGLFLAQNIVLGAGGRLWVEDRVPGDHSKGAKFIVLLPRARVR